MNRFRLIAPALALLALLLAASPSRATLEIALQEAGVNGGAIHVVKTGGDFTDVTFSGTYGDFTIKILGGTSDNGATLSDLLSASTSVTNNSGKTKTLKIWITQTDYTAPAGSRMVVESGLGGSVSKGALTLTNIYQAYADKNNHLFGTSGYTEGPQTATKHGSTFDTGSATGLFTRTATHPYSLTSVITFTLSGGGKANYSSHVNVTAAVPAPAGLVLAASGAAALALARLRRRKLAVHDC
jgi:hypothetical protein